MEQKPVIDTGAIKSMQKKHGLVKPFIIAGCVALGLIILPLLAININYLCWELQPPIPAQ